MSEQQIRDFLMAEGWHISDGVDSCSGNDTEAQDRSIKELAAKIARPAPKTYMFTFTPTAELAIIEAVMPQEDAIHETGKTLKLFGWREGILHTINTLETFLKSGYLDTHIMRIKLNSAPRQTPDGRTFPGCAACGYSPEADKTMWTEMVQALDAQLSAPPEGEVKPGAPEVQS